MLRNYHLLFFVLYSCLGALGQTAVVHGTIIDKVTGEPLFSANIRSGEIGTISSLEGKFRLELTPGEHILTISYVGYESEEIEVDLTGDDDLEISVELGVSNNLLNTATVTGTKYEQRIAESVVSIDVLKPALLENTNTTNIEGIFNKIPGVQIIDGQPNIRGGSGWAYNAGNRVMLLVDDIPALQPDAGRAQWADIPAENVAQIEVIKGAASTMYGSAAMNGVINVRTDYATSEPETVISLFHTRFSNFEDTRKNWYDHTPQDFGFSASHKQKAGKWDIVTAAYYQRQDSTKAFRQEDFRYKLRGSLNLRYRATDRLNFGFNSIFNKGSSSSYFLWKNGTTGALQPFPGTVTRSENDRFMIDPFLTYFDGKNNKHRFHGRIYRNDNDNNLNQSNRSVMLYGEYQFHRAFDELGLNLAAGVVGSTIDSDAEFFGNADIRHNNFATFFQLDKNFGERLNLSGGIRYEYHKQRNGEIQHPRITVEEGETSEGQFIGRFGLNYTLSEGTFLRASIGQGYRFPILIERFLSTEFGGFVILPNPDLVSERGMSAEIGLKQGFRVFGLQGYLDVAGFLQRYENMMEFTFVTEPTFGFKALNIGDTEIAGFEIGVAANSTIFNVPINIYGGYSYIDPKYQEFTPQLREISSLDENVLKYRTRHSFTMDIQANYKNAMFGIAIQGASHMLAIDAILETFIPDLRQYRNVNNTGYRVLDARVGYTFDQIRVSFHFKNFLNQEYTQRPGLIEAPRNFGIRLDWKL